MSDTLDLIKKKTEAYEQQLKDNGEIVEQAKLAITDEDGNKIEEMNLGDLYSINKSIISTTEKDISPNKMRKLIKQAIVSLFREGHYYILLNRERNDYTVFRYTGDHAEAEAALKDCIDLRGTCKVIQKIENGFGYEIWIYDKNLDDSFVYYLINCDLCIVEC